MEYADRGSCYSFSAIHVAAWGWIRGILQKIFSSEKTTQRFDPPLQSISPLAAGTEQLRLFRHNVICRAFFFWNTESNCDCGKSTLSRQTSRSSFCFSTRMRLEKSHASNMALFGKLFQGQFIFTDYVIKFVSRMLNAAWNINEGRSVMFIPLNTAEVGGPMNVIALYSPQRNTIIVVQN